MVFCGNCKIHHATAQDVRECYADRFAPGEYEPDFETDTNPEDDELALRQAEARYERTIYGE